MKIKLFYVRLFAFLPRAKARGFPAHDSDEKTPKVKILKHWFFNISSTLLQVIPFSPFNHIGDTTLKKWYSMHESSIKFPNTYSFKPDLEKILKTVDYLMECAKQSIRALEKQQIYTYHQ